MLVWRALSWAPSWSHSWPTCVYTRGSTHGVKFRGSRALHLYDLLLPLGPDEGTPKPRRSGQSLDGVDVDTTPPEWPKLGQNVENARPCGPDKGSRNPSRSGQNSDGMDETLPEWGTQTACRRSFNQESEGFSETAKHWLDNINIT